jgi:hypothetical protein
VAPIVPPAPVRFSTITGWPHISASFCITGRAPMASMPLPGEKGTITRTGLMG